MSGGNKLQDLYDSLFGPDDDAAECAYSCAGQRSDNCAQITGLPRDVMPASELVTKQPETKENLQCVGPDGLSLFKAWLSSSQQKNILTAIRAEGWLTDTANQAMCFGQLPRWTHLLADGLPLEHWPVQIRSRHPVFDQMIVNSYKPGEGIKSHIDLMKFDDGIAIMSLGSPATMTFTRAEALGTAMAQSAGHAADLPNMQLDLDSVTLSAALGLGGDNALAQFQRNLSDQNGQSSSDLSAILAASLGLPGQTSLGTLLGNEGLTGSLGATGMFNLPHLLPQTSLISSKDNQSLAGLSKSGATSTQPKPSVEIEEHAESDEHSEGDEGSAGTKRKGPMTEEDKKRRRQEINRQSARRIRERRSHEMERLKQQNALLQHQLGQLLKYASSLAREKNVLVQRTMELTERWNQAAAENIELRVKAAPPANNPGSAAVGTYRHNQTQSDSPQPPQQEFVALFGRISSMLVQLQLARMA
ncbi:hypothetical protein WJX79_008153 [Trebouxia sp. C0005]